MYVNTQSTEMSRVFLRVLSLARSFDGRSGFAFYIFAGLLELWADTLPR
ncbi:hypothetical protein [Thermoactinomyces sp. DSM 45892]|nr:hypothetical protein [Thermoactinomyces sp. DSM 45892]